MYSQFPLSPSTELCLGQPLPSRTGDSSAGPQRALSEWVAGRLGARQLNGRFLLIAQDEARNK